MSDFETFTFLQLANVLIDSSLVDELALTGESRAKRRQEALENFIKAIAEAKKRQVDAVLLVGNLWQTETITLNSIVAVSEALANLDDIPVFITPSVYDYNSFDSPYDDRFLKARGIQPFSSNVHIFRKDEFNTIRHPKLAGITFTGHSGQNADPAVLIALKNELTTIKGPTLRLVLMPDKIYSDQQLALSKTNSHANVDDEEMDTAQSSEGRSPTKYMALGSGKQYAELTDEHGNVVGAQSGSLTAQTRLDLGKRFGLFTQYIKKPDGTLSGALEPVEFDNRRILSLNFDISGLNLSDATSEILNLLEEEGARKGIDMILIELEGNYHPGQEPELLRQALKDSFFHTVIVDKMRPNYLAETFTANSPEDRFVKALFNRQTNTGDLVEDALYYGLDALKQKQVILRDFN
jgi:DNA repair exonuclease SbcCD nuclease subunit